MWRTDRPSRPLSSTLCTVSGEQQKALTLGTNGTAAGQPAARKIVNKDMGGGCRWERGRRELAPEGREARGSFKLALRAVPVSVPM